MAEEIRKELLAAQLEILIRDMVVRYSEWRSNCGHGGWYNMNDAEIRKFFESYIIEAAKKGISAYK